jgi:prepilin-type N-terminal cleavage/methylation domain-containing protein
MRARDGGFTLVEVMIALAIIAVTAIVLLDRRVDLVRDAARSRDLRAVWALASQKMAELELDKTLWTGTGAQSNGDFSEIDPSYREVLWEYLVIRQPVDVKDPADDQTKVAQPEILRLTLGVRAPGMDMPVVLEGLFPIQEIQTSAPDGKEKQ